MSPGGQDRSDSGQSPERAIWISDPADRHDLVVFAERARVLDEAAGEAAVTFGAHSASRDYREIRSLCIVQKGNESSHGNVQRTAGDLFVVRRLCGDRGPLHDTDWVRARLDLRTFLAAADAHLFEFDDRFAKLGGGFSHYDYRRPRRVSAAERADTAPAAPGSR